MFFRNLADVSLTDEDTNSILTDIAISEIPSKQCDNACGATLWPNFLLRVYRIPCTVVRKFSEIVRIVIGHMYNVMIFRSQEHLPCISLYL